MKKGHTPKYSEQLTKQVYFNPYSKGNEVFVKRKDLPELEPMWGDDKGEFIEKVYKFLNTQNLRIVKEIEPKSCQAIAEDLAGPATMMV